MRRLSVFSFAVFVCSVSALGAQSASDQIVAKIDSVVVAQAVATSDSSSVALVTAQPAGLNRSRVVDERVAANLLPEARFAASRFTLDDTTRRKAVTYSDWYARRLRVHRYGSYAMLPLFVTQYVLGNKLINQKEDQYSGKRTTPIDQGLRNTHVAVASAVGVLFIVNTTTGLWNLFESRHTVEGRKLRTIHALTMLAADAGFLYTGKISSDAVDHGPPEARKHRNAALVSFGISTAGASLMWFRRD